MNQSLSGLRVLDLSRILAGPWCGQLLADLGADVIKIERPETGDDTRRWGPPFLNGDDSSDAAYFLCANRGKRSVTVDFTKPPGQEIIRQLVGQSDVLIENFKVGGLRAYGLDYEALKKVNPRLIYCSVTGFGQSGPYASRPGYDFLIQAMGGLMSITGRKQGTSGAGPQKAGVALTDILTGLYGSVGILAAVAHRERTGEGQHIDVALLDVQIAALANQAMNYLVGGVSPAPMGNAHPNIVPYQDFETRDGHIIIAVGNDAQFFRLCSALGGSELAEDNRYGSNSGRVEHRDELIGAITELTRAKDSQEILRALESVGVPCGPINDIEAVFDDPNVVAREIRVDLPHASGGSAPSVANPIRLSATPVQYRNAPPTLGQHTDSVLAELLNISNEALSKLRAEKVL